MQMLCASCSVEFNISCIIYNFLVLFAHVLRIAMWFAWSRYAYGIRHTTLECIDTAAISLTIAAGNHIDICPSLNTMQSKASLQGCSLGSVRSSLSAIAFCLSFSALNIHGRPSRELAP